MSTNNNQDKKSTDTKPKGEVKTSILQPKGYSTIIKKRKT